MRLWTKTVATAVLAGALMAGGVAGGLWTGADRAYAASTASTVNGVINVTGSGEVLAKPDIAYLSIGVQSEGNTAAAAQKANATKLNKVTQLLKEKWSISADDIQTSQFYVQPNYTYNEKEGQKLKGYTANHTLSVKYRDLDKIGQLLDEATKSGANNVDNVRFSVENPSTYEEEAITKALGSAQSKASAVAKAAKRGLGALVNVTVDGGEAQVFTQRENAMSKSLLDVAGSGTEIQSGQVTVTVQVSAQYEMN
ncbi:SIMPL domain-containing protein [Paenibacillus sp. LX16]|uniref:SIMPL domain-containing protein n=1 Tax=Paenibacillus sp. LX16 TaxID=1740264 RepID=UPI0019E04EEC|nr:SIMPL domain-containing protein [Paenibacillus sp. LX16]KAF6627819.1 SIMPL domain-containing protein [Paenibacillus sp. EKM208P]